MNPLKIMKLPKPIMKASFAVGTFVKKNAPEILLTVGLATSAGAVITAVNAAPKAAVALDQIKDEVELNSYPTTGTTDLATRLDIYRAHIGEVIRPFVIPMALESISITCILTSYGVMKKRHAALTLAYQALDAAFSQYRMRVIEDAGAEKDEYYRTGVINGKCKVVDDETGEVKEVEGKILDEKSGSSIYARYFDSNSKQFKKDPTYNMMFLKGKQHEWNQVLISRGYVFLNEVYDDLSLPVCAEGQVVGWINDPEVGECCVDFGITEGWKIARKHREDNIYDHAILLDFNVDGPVYEYLNKMNARKLAEVTPCDSDILPPVDDYPKED